VREVVKLNLQAWAVFGGVRHWKKTMTNIVFHDFNEFMNQNVLPAS
jgi:hypothetical protein